MIGLLLIIDEAPHLIEGPQTADQVTRRDLY